MTDHPEPVAVTGALLPCPFCGEAGEIDIAPASQASGSLCVYRGRCEHCGYGLDWTPDEAEAIAAWNRRTPPPDDAALVVDMGQHLNRRIIELAASETSILASALQIAAANFTKTSKSGIDSRVAAQFAKQAKEATELADRIIIKVGI